MNSLLKTLAAATALVAACCGSASAQDRFITVASTTSTEQSGLFGDTPTPASTAVPCGTVGIATVYLYA